MAPMLACTAATAARTAPPPSRRPAARQSRSCCQCQASSLRALPLGSTAASAATALAVLLDCSGASAAETTKVAEFATSGLIFKDTVRVLQVQDDQVDGVVLYLTDYQRSITERLAKDLFGDPSQASLTCVAAGPVTVRDEAAIQGSEGKEIFSERKGINLFQNKNLRVRRIFDDKNRAVLYVAYSTRFNGAAEEAETSQSRYRTSVCAVPLAAPALLPVAATDGAAP